MKPIVSVCIFTYNHENYINQCLESVLMQNTNFDFEIVIGEDYSKDNTRLICEEYEEKHPRKIRLLDRDKNLGMCENIFNSLKHCEGKYTAILDGDDYWIHPLKLQKQFEFMESNKEMNLVFHQSFAVNELTSKLDYFVTNEKISYTINDIIDKWIMATGFMFFRTEAMDYPDFLSHTHNFDLIIQLILNRNGEKTGYINEIMSVYRINVGSNTNNQNYNAINTSKRKKLLFEEYNQYSNYKFSSKINSKLKEIENMLKKSGKFSYQFFIKKIFKLIFKFFGYKIVKVG